MLLLMRVLEVELLVVAQGLLKVRNNDKELIIALLLGVTANESIGGGVAGRSTRTTKSKK